MKNFKKQAEEWAEEYLSSEEAKHNIKRLDDDLLEFFLFGSIGMIKDKEGNLRSATREELRNALGKEETISTSGIVERYKQRKN